jgi:uncharacterized ferritin-like protein (DUF455 family)
LKIIEANKMSKVSINSSTGVKTLIHRICHMESYAIDLVKIKVKKKVLGHNQ